MRRNRMKKVPLSEVKDDLSCYLHIAERQEVIITRHGKPAGILIGFESEDDWFDYRLENDPRFLRRIQSARRSLKDGLGTRLEDVKECLAGPESAESLNPPIVGPPELHGLFDLRAGQVRLQRLRRQIRDFRVGGKTQRDQLLLAELGNARLQRRWKEFLEP